MPLLQLIWLKYILKAYFRIKNLEDLTQRISQFRIEIDNIDKEIVSLLNRRAQAAIQIGHVKREFDAPVYCPSREEDVIANVQKSNPGPLSDDAICRLFERIIDESRRLERESSGNNK